MGWLEEKNFNNEQLWYLKLEQEFTKKFNDCVDPVSGYFNYNKWVRTKEKYEQMIKEHTDRLLHLSK